MKIKASLIVLSLAAGAYAQTLDLHVLDKLGEKAKSVNRITLDHDQLQAALKMLPADKEDAKDNAQTAALLSKLESVTVRTLEFSSKGQYSEHDLDPIRKQMENLKGWSKIVDSKEDGERSEVFMLTTDGKPMGLGIIAVESTEVSVVLIKGPMNLNDLGNLHGVLGMPGMQLKPGDH